MCLLYLCECSKKSSIFTLALSKILRNILKKLSEYKFCVCLCVHLCVHVCVCMCLCVHVYGVYVCVCVWCVCVCVCVCMVCVCFYCVRIATYTKACARRVTQYQRGDSYRSERSYPHRSLQMTACLGR